MRITAVRAWKPPCASPPDRGTALGPILVAIETDARFVGYGVEGGREAAVHIMGTVLRDRLLGRDIEPVEEHWQAMYRATLPFGRKGVASMALGTSAARRPGVRSRSSCAGARTGTRHPRLGPGRAAAVVQSTSWPTHTAR
jgi:hypothetical protein